MVGQASKALKATIAVALGPTVAALTGFIAQQPILAAALLVVYELVVLVAGVALSAIGELRKRWVSSLAEYLDAKVQRIISRYGRAYTRYMLASQSHMDLRGLTTRGEYALGLRDVFIQLSLEPNSLHRLSASPLEYAVGRYSTGLSDGSSDASDRRKFWRIFIRIFRRCRSGLNRVVSVVAKRIEDKQQARHLHHERTTIWDWLLEARASESVLVVIGPPGSGKTTLLKHVAVTLAKRRSIARGHWALSKIPVLIALRDHRNRFEGSQKDPSLADLIRDELQDVHRKEPPGWVESQLEHGRFLVMLDGLDEVATGPTRKRISDWAERQRRAFPEILFVVTSRPFGYKSAPLNSAIIVQVQPFAEKHVKQFVESWYETTSIRAYGGRSEAARLHASRSAYALLGKLRESPNLLGLTVNPLLLTMVANVHHYRGALPGSRAELYKEICEVLLGKRHQARGVSLDLSVPQKLAVLQELAYRMMMEGTRDVTPEDAETWISDVLSRVAPHVAAAKFMLHVEESSGLLVEREHETYTFAHLTFQEYLASVHVRENQLVSTLLDNVHSSWWRETILLFAAQADATPIVHRCLEDISDLSLLSLATQCSEEGREISLQARHALTTFLEVDVRSDTERRKAAAAVKLFRRLQEFVRVGEDEYIAPEPISCLEYQLFIDETTIFDPAVPDHWSESVFPYGSDNSPAMGVRRLDADRFCRWLRELYGDQWHYQFPNVEQVANLILSPKVDPEKPSVLPALRESTYAAMGGKIRRYQSIVTAAVEGFELPIDLLEERIYRDQIQASQLLSPANTGPQYVRDNCGLDLGEILQVSYLQAIFSEGSANRRKLLESLESAKAVDLGVAALVSESIAREIFELRGVGALTSAKASTLIGLSQALNYSMAICFNRSASPALRLTGSSDERFYGRLVAAAAAEACSAVIGDDSLGAPNLALWRHADELLKRLTAGSLRRTRLLRGDDQLSRRVERLAQQFRMLYCMLALFELRVERKLPAWEGLYLSRKPKMFSSDFWRRGAIVEEDGGPPMIGITDHGPALIWPIREP